MDNLDLNTVINFIEKRFPWIDKIDTEVKKVWLASSYKGSEEDKNYLYAMGGLLLLGIITGIANNAKNIGKFFKRLFKKKPKCARR